MHLAAVFLSVYMFHYLNHFMVLGDILYGMLCPHFVHCHLFWFLSVHLAGADSVGFISITPFLSIHHCSFYGIAASCGY
jgi:hypothetical protein